MIHLGLRHVHLLLWLKTPIRPDEIDSIIKAELPNPQDELLSDIVTKYMIHGPCGVCNSKASCMENNKCKKTYF